MDTNTNIPRSISEWKRQQAEELEAECMERRAKNEEREARVSKMKKRAKSKALRFIECLEEDQFYGSLWTTPYLSMATHITNDEYPERAYSEVRVQTQKKEILIGHLYAGLWKIEAEDDCIIVTWRFYD